ncbi:putative secreted protein (Por secretion system target) [Winogradskyella wandonensis]|uniref:Putative secreted protein (Por secretion system target) n=1 Tax=Winogradskyella wandonensis TaxID=1442586 RepID=A0A4R1KVM4_9FLAO|nr:T9SS type A sorting domain-containing protein [Winogradskyella wandonensis]TCK68753.1 putative secreted protein (Por secretion system target) [Winogradskyella wandonensis]
MKTNIRLIVFFISTFQILLAQTTIIPDANFENYLETHTADGTEVNVGNPESMGDGIENNSLVLTNRIQTVTSLNIIELQIENIIGIEEFLALEVLVCNNNRIASIDVSANANLRLLNVSNNRLIGELTVSNNPNLESLFCSSNQINLLNLNNNTVLKNLDASNNRLTDLDLSNINSIACPDPQTDPVTLCQGAATINVSRNQLTALVVNNGFNDLVSVFDATDNPDLPCIQIDAGFTPGNNWVKDDWAYFSENMCADIFTYVPDDNFEQELINQGYDDLLDNLVLRANIENLTTLDVSSASIVSLEGIEDFIALVNLNCSGNAIETVDLSANTALEDLDISDNALLDLDLSANTSLLVINVQDNNMPSLDVSNNTLLTNLDCSGNSLTDLALDFNVLITDLDCAFNQIESLDLSNNTALISTLCNDNNLFALNLINGNNAAITNFNALNNPNLFCIEVDDVAFANGAAGWQKDAAADYNLNCGTYVPDNNFEQALIDLGIDSDNTLNNYVPTGDINMLTDLDISGLAIEDLTGIEDFTALVNLNCSDNSLSVLELTTNLALSTIYCANNQIEDLDLSINANLTSIICNDNALISLNIANGNNAGLTTFNAEGNPNLFCINVDNAILGNIPMAWQIDTTASYNDDCVNNRITLITDPVFEQKLIDFGYDNVIDGQVLTANIELVQTLNVSDEGISDLTGIRDFKSLVELDCSGNFLDDLDVSNMVNLERLNCSSNFFLTNDINDTNGLLNTTGTIALLELFCAGNNLSNLDTSLNENLQVLDCADNNITNLNVSNNLALVRLNCSNNSLSALDISANTLLEDLNSDSNQLQTLTTISTLNTTLTRLSCANNSLSDLVVTSYQALSFLNCGTNSLNALNVQNNPDLSFLSATNNQITAINLMNNGNLVEALLSQNNLTELDLSGNPILEQLNCSFNDINSINLASNPLLEFLGCANNQLTTIDLTANTNLIEINASTNSLATINLSSNLGNLKRIDLSNNQLEDDLDLSSMAISACVFQPGQTDFCPETITINVSNNLLSFLNIQNGINPEIASLNATGNPNLDCIQVDDANSIGAGWIKDDATEYNIDCNFGETFVPDDNFEQALIDLGYDSGPLNDYVPTINIETLINLDVSGNNIADLTGIEDFEALQTLNCSNNSLTELIIDQNTNLISLNCSENQLSNLSVLNNTLLNIINCASNTISALDLSNNSSLTDLDISNNSFTTFLPSEVLSLESFNCDFNQITELDFQLNQNMTSINCASNLLEVLNIKNGQNNSLSFLDAQNNPDLTCIETDNGTVPAGVTWLTDATAQFSDNCFFGQTFVPDDNFEQALIDLGFDSGALDDYVQTATIETITFLNISSREISDLTGIEDFIALQNLNFEINTISSVDLSNNSALVDLDTSDNLLTEIDVSSLTQLLVLDVSKNDLSQIDIDANVRLIDLNVSDNSIENLNVDTLTNLEDLNCSNNLIGSLSLTQNINLEILFCQSNMLIDDQLNIQNGNNQNIQIFNATNNPDLGCILVDNPVAVIENTDGTYDNWSKDDTATYQIVCLDADNDGVPNVDDLCPGTPFGATVDLFGCAIPDLPNNNFLISITSETCLNSNNGIISIETQEVYNYTATLTSDDFNQAYNFTNDVDIFNLLAGTYELCITIEEWPDYELCYTIVIEQPDPLSVFSSRIAGTNRLALDMSGNLRYNIEFNGESFVTYNPELQLELQQGINTLKVTTDLECQGVFEETIIVTDEFLVYPNPFNNDLKIYNGISDEEVDIKIYSLFGQLVFSKIIQNQGSTIEVDTSSLASGMYVIMLQSDSMRTTHKIIKE